MIGKIVGFVFSANVLLVLFLPTGIAAEQAAPICDSTHIAPTGTTITTCVDLVPPGTTVCPFITIQVDQSGSSIKPGVAPVCVATSVSAIVAHDFCIVVASGVILTIDFPPPLVLGFAEGVQICGKLDLAGQCLTTSVDLIGSVPMPIITRPTRW